MLLKVRKKDFRRGKNLIQYSKLRILNILRLEIKEGDIVITGMYSTWYAGTFELAIF